jgi:hypothetical protein
MEDQIGSVLPHANHEYPGTGASCGELGKMRMREGFPMMSIKANLSVLLWPLEVSVPRFGVSYAALDDNRLWCHRH